LGSGLGGVLNIGPGLGRNRLPEGPRADPSDVRTVGAGYGATGAQVMVDPTPGRPSVAQRTAEPDVTGGTDLEGSQRAKDEQQD
jgi:two-component system sensor histidine kinase MtrB